MGASSTCSVRVLGCVAGVLVAACSAVPPAPELLRATPAWGWTGEATDIHVEGRHLYPDVILGGAAGAEVDASFDLFLETDTPTPLDGVTLDDYHTLGAEVPAGIPPGWYGLRVVTPAGLEASLENAFEVRSTRADHFSLSSSRGGYSVGEYADVELALLDPNGGLAIDPTRVILEASSDAGAAGVHFEPDKLPDQALAAEGVGITGSLSGSAVVRVTSLLEDDVWLTVSSPDDPALTPASFTLSWDPGPIDHLAVHVAEDDHVVSAGESVPVDIEIYDASDALITGGYPLQVRLEGSALCGDPTPDIVDLNEPGPYMVTFTRACEGNALRVEAGGLDGAVSEAFDVLPGPVAGYGVAVVPRNATAGGLIAVTVDAEDACGNHVDTYVSQAPLLRDSVGGVDSTTGEGQPDCEAFTGGTAFCFAYPTVADPEVTVGAQGADGLVGVSAPIVVVPGAPDHVGVDVRPTVVMAGDAFLVSLALFDAYDNEILVDPASEPVDLVDDTGTLACVLDGGGALVYDCILTRATPLTALSASIRGVGGQDPEGLAVENAVLARVDLDPVGVPLQAGDTFTLNLRGYDAWDNLYVVPKSGVQVDLSDATGTLRSVTANLNVAGEAAVAEVITRASDVVTIEARQAGNLLGVSAPFVVRAGPIAALAVDVAPWVERGGDATVTLRAVDAWDNPIPDYRGPVHLAAQQGDCDDVDLATFTGGSATADLTCPVAGLDETLSATDDEGNVGTSAAFDVLDFGCATHPTAALTLDGSTSATVCLTSGLASVTADASASTGATLWHFTDSDGADVDTLRASAALSWTTAGIRRVTAVAVDAEACADRAEGYVYVGEDDGEPAGELALSVADASLATGARTTVTVTATTCTGDVAAGGTVQVWADLGTVDGTVTGRGLELTLDATGSATFGWGFGTGYAGTGTVRAGAVSGAAYGEATVDVTGDRVRPMVVGMIPMGTWSDVVAEIDVDFTEPVLAFSVNTTTVGLSGPEGAVPSTFVLVDDGRRLVITPDTPVDAAAGVWSVTLTQSLRDDAAGNKLSGDWTGGAADWSGAFGALSDTLPGVAACSIDGDTFTPDGDDGALDQADEVRLAPTADAPVSWWRFEAVDDGGTAVRTAWSPGTTTEVTWDGRGDDGRIVASGEYMLVLSAVDAQGNAAAVCTEPVALRRLVELP